MKKSIGAMILSKIADKSIKDGMIVKKQSGDPEQERAMDAYHTEPHHEIAKDIMDAITTKNTHMLAEALKAHFEYLESRPHKENESEEQEYKEE